MKCLIVSHTHWDREWYRTFQSFRARLVDTVDRVLDLIAADAGFHFLLDGQTIVLEDYCEIRPDRRPDLERACRAGRISIGPWYVQPDLLLPSGEAHVRNLLQGRRTGATFGPVSCVAYCPDSFGHPGQLPQLLAGFGLAPFVYWRGNGDEIDSLPAEYLWEAPDGTAVLACHLREGYFAAAGLPRDPEAAALWLADLAAALRQRSANDCVVLMNGIDHARPQSHTAAVASALARRTGWEVRRGLLEDFARELCAEPPRFRGELVGGRIANLLPGVWSTRMPLKLRNRRIEVLLEGWAEPWSALAHLFGAADERPALRLAWSALLQNQAHDSICGCSLDRVHEQMQLRYDSAEELALETARRSLERLAGLGLERRTPWAETFDVAVFNPSPAARTDVVRFPLEPDTWFDFRGDRQREMALHPWLYARLAPVGFTVDGEPARLVDDSATDRVRLLPERPPQSIEFIAKDVPAFGWRRFRIAPADPVADLEDDGREIGGEGMRVCAADDGTFTIDLGGRSYAGLCGLEDTGDRGDTYDFDPVAGGQVCLDGVSVTRRRHAAGFELLSVRRALLVPLALDADRSRRSAQSVELDVVTEARLAAGVPRIDLGVRVVNRARDHRLRLLFPTGHAVDTFHAATTFDIARRDTRRRDASGWVHPAPATFPQQGFVSANGLTVAAPGLPEAEVTPDGTIAITLLRAVGWLARTDLRTRPQPAGPALPVPGAQCLGEIAARLALFGALDPRAVRDAELGLFAVAAGEEPLLPPLHAALEIEPREILLSALKPSESGPGLIVRLLNPTGHEREARVRAGFPLASVVPVRLDESPCGDALPVKNNGFVLPLPPHALRSVRLEHPTA